MSSEFCTLNFGDTTPYVLCEYARHAYYTNLCLSLGIRCYSHIVQFLYLPSFFMMNWTQQKDTRKISTLSYLIFSILAFFLIKNKLIDEYAVWLIPLGVMMIIRDLTPFLGTLRTVGHRVLSFQAVSQQYRS